AASAPAVPSSSATPTPSAPATPPGAAAGPRLLTAPDSAGATPPSPRPSLPPGVEEDAEAARLATALSQVPLMAETPFDDIAETQADGPPRPAAARPTSISGVHVPQIPGHEVVEEIGRGAMGLVYHAKDRRLGRSVAIKILRAGELASGSTIERFRREALALARISHPVIVPIYDVGDYNGLPYFTMEFIAGRSLTELINKREIATMQALEWTEKIADALDMAHQHGVIHRDVKPSNIMVDRRLRVRLMDFGLAKHLDSDSHYTVSGTTIGTPAYMPPEQARGTSSRVDARSDVYGLGAVLYEMVTGRPPFTGKSVLDVIMKVLNEEPEHPRKFNKQLHPDIETIILKCLEKNPERRYPTALALRDDIARFRNGEPIQARPPSFSRKLARWISRYQTPIVAGVSAVLLVCAVYLAVKVGIWQGESQVKNPVVRNLPPPPRQEIKDQVSYKTEPLYDRATDGPLDQLDSTKNPKQHWRQNPQALYDAPSLFSTRANDHESYFAEPPWFESAKADIDITVDATPLKNDAPEPELDDCLRVGFSTFQIDPHNESYLPLVITWSDGRLRLTGVEDPDQNAEQIAYWKGLKALCEGPGPDLKPGKYRVTLEKSGYTFSCSIFNLDKPDQPIGSLVYHDLNLMKWQYKHTALTVRKASGPIHIDSITGYRRSLTEQSKLMAAYGKLYIGEFQGAVEGFEDLTAKDAKPEPGVHHEHLRAWLGLAMCHEIRAELPAAEAAYERTIADAQADLKAHPNDPAIQAILHTARVRELINALKVKSYDHFDQEVAQLPADFNLGDWSGSAVREVDALRQDARFKEAIDLIRLAWLPDGGETYDAAAEAIAIDLLKQPRPVSDPLIDQLAMIHPTAGVSIAALARVRDDLQALPGQTDPTAAAALRARIADHLELFDRPFQNPEPALQQLAMQYLRLLDMHDEEQRREALTVAQLHSLDHPTRLAECEKIFRQAGKLGLTDFTLKLYDALALTLSYRNPPADKVKVWQHQLLRDLDETGRLMLDNDQPVSAILPLLENRDDPALMPLLTRCIHSLTRAELTLDQCQQSIAVLRQARRIFDNGDFANSEIKEQARTEFNLRVGDLAAAIVAKNVPSADWKALLLKVLYEYPDRSETRAVRRGVELLMAEPDTDTPAALKALQFLVVARSNLRSEGWPLEGLAGWLMAQLPYSQETAAQELTQRMLEGNTDPIFAVQWTLERADMDIRNGQYDAAWRLLEGVATSEGSDDTLGRWRAAALVRLAGLLEWTHVDQTQHIGNPALFPDGDISPAALLNRVEKQGADVEITSFARQMLGHSEALQDPIAGYMLSPAATLLPGLQPHAVTDRKAAFATFKQLQAKCDKDHRWPDCLLDAIETTLQSMPPPKPAPPPAPTTPAKPATSATPATPATPARPTPPPASTPPAPAKPATPATPAPAQPAAPPTTPPAKH
ncbi:MAG: serine/threonine-protein kinase, partial [Planctomycetota bacterium]